MSPLAAAPRPAATGLPEGNGAPGPISARRLVEVAAFPPPVGSWSIRIGLLARRWRALGGRCDLVNIGASRALQDPAYVNVRGPVDLLWKALRYAASGAAIHTHTNGKGLKGTLIALALQALAIPFGRHTALTFHAGHIQDYFPRTGRRLLDGVMRLAFLTPRAVICNSEAVRRLIVEQYRVRPEKVHAIPAFCAAYLDAGREPDLSDPVRRFVEAHDPLVLCYVSSEAAEFRVPNMIEALGRIRQRLPNAGLVDVGDERFFKPFQARIDEAGLGDAVLTTGPVDRPELLELMRRATVFLRTPVGDGVAASVLEALSLGTPVVASDNGTRPPGCILFRDGDVEAMTACLIRVAEEHDRIAARLPSVEAFDTLEAELAVLGRL